MSQITECTIAIAAVLRDARQIGPHAVKFFTYSLCKMMIDNRQKYFFFKNETPGNKISELDAASLDTAVAEANYTETFAWAKLYSIFCGQLPGFKDCAEASLCRQARAIGALPEAADVGHGKQELLVTAQLASLWACILQDSGHNNRHPLIGDAFVLMAKLLNKPPAPVRYGSVSNPKRFMYFPLSDASIENPSPLVKLSALD
jgi:hypothetical protein